MLPEALIEPTLKKWHCNALGGHLGAKKLLSIVSKRFVIPRGSRVAKKITTTCATCVRRKANAKKNGLLASKPPTEPWRTVAMDFAGPYTTSRSGMAYVLVFVDHFTKWVELVPTSDQTAQTVVEQFFKRIICQHGCPEYLLSDNGPQFRSSAVDELCKNFGIRKIFSSAYYPQGDGYAERMMRTLNNSLAAMSSQCPFRWDAFLPGIQFAYNSASHEATGVSPFLATTGREPRVPGETAIAPNNEPQDLTVEYVRKLRNIIFRPHEAEQGSLFSVIGRECNNGTM